MKLLAEHSVVPWTDEDKENYFYRNWRVLLGFRMLHEYDKIGVFNNGMIAYVIIYESYMEDSNPEEEVALFLKKCPRLRQWIDPRDFCLVIRKEGEFGEVYRFDPHKFNMEFYEII